MHIFILKKHLCIIRIGFVFGGDGDTDTWMDGDEVFSVEIPEVPQVSHIIGIDQPIWAGWADQKHLEFINIGERCVTENTIANHRNVMYK